LKLRIIEKLMHVCFLLEQKYAPYSKWLGKAFTDLSCAETLNPIFSKALFSLSYEEREQALGDAYVFVANLMNSSGLIPPQPVGLSRPYSTRPGRCIKASLFANACANTLPDE